MMKRSWIIVAILLVTGAVCWAQPDGPSLADVAKQNKETRKAKLVLSDDDVSYSPALASSSDNASGSGAPAAGADKHDTDSKGADKNATESAKAGKTGTGDSASSKDSSPVAELKKKLDSLKEQQDSWKHSAQRYQDLLANESDDFRRQTYQDALDNDQKNVSLYQKNIDDTQAQLTKAQNQKQ
jgi:hypothetical protein